MSLLYKCDRPGCKKTNTFEMKEVSVSVFNGLGDADIKLHLCNDCWIGLQRRYMDLETEFYHELEKK